MITKDEVPEFIEKARKEEIEEVRKLLLEDEDTEQSSQQFYLGSLSNLGNWTYFKNIKSYKFILVYNCYSRNYNSNCNTFINNL